MRVTKYKVIVSLIIIILLNINILKAEERKEVEKTEETELLAKEFSKKYLNKEFYSKDVKCENETSLENSFECIIFNLAKISKQGDNIKLFTHYDEIYGEDLIIESLDREATYFNIYYVSAYKSGNFNIISLAINNSSWVEGEDDRKDITSIDLKPIGNGKYKLVSVDFIT